jgi:hypothetical protein
VQGACVSTSSLWIASGLSSPSGIALDAANVYWTDLGAGTVRSVAKTGGTVTVLASGQGHPEGPVVDDTYIYWSNNIGGAVMRTRKDGTGAPAVVVAVTSPRFITVDSTYVYVCAASAFLRAPKDGSGSPTAFGSAFDCSTPTAASSTTMYDWTPTNSTIGEFIQTLDLATGTVTTGGELHLVQALAASATQLVVSDSQGIYDSTTSWTSLFDAAGAQLVAVAPCGAAWYRGFIWLGVDGNAQPIPLIAGMTPVQMATDDAAIYWLDANGGVGRLPLP